MIHTHHRDFHNWINITQCESVSEIFKGIFENSKILGFIFLYYEAANLPDLKFNSNLKPNVYEWERHYRTVTTEIDRHSQQQKLFSPLIWGETRRELETNGRLVRHAQSLGITAGVTIPMYSGSTIVSIFTFESREFNNGTDLPDDIIEIMVPMLYFGQQRLLSVHQKESQPEKKFNLTKREIECLRWAAAGKSSWETGQILHCSERTINFHINNAMRKLNVSKRPMAVAAALSLGVLAMPG